MHKASTLIRANQGQFPECAYYLPLLTKARRNSRLHPDICIEICKSLLEGISKTVVIALDPASKEDLDNKSVHQIVRMAARVLRYNDDQVEDDFVTRASSLANAMGTLRNVRGDISHGKSVPKEVNSSEDLAKLCLQMTDALAFYMLESFFVIQRKALAAAALPATEPVPASSGIPDIAYDQNPDFNDQLDADNPVAGKILYSDALYRLYYEDYVIELKAYQDAQQEALEGEDDQ